MGRSQKISSMLEQQASHQGVSVCQRISGGGAVLASPNLVSLTTIIPINHPLGQVDLVNCFRAAGSAWQRALFELNVESQVCSLVEKPKKALSWVCFAGASHGEIFTPGGKKLIGLAQVRKRHAVAVMSGFYLEPINWSLLFSVHNGTVRDREIAQIQLRTTSLSEAGARFGVTGINALFSRYAHYLEEFH